MVTRVNSPTQTPIPSDDVRDMLFNSNALDLWATSIKKKYTDRFGKERITSYGMELFFNDLMEEFKEECLNAIKSTDFGSAGTFQKGAFFPNNELTLKGQALRDERTGEYYFWDGEFPKRVIAGSTPEGTGGIGIGKWVGVGESSLRIQLSDTTGYKLIGGLEEEYAKKPKLVFDIVEYGAVPDGVSPQQSASLGAPCTGTDNSIAIKKAITEAQLAVSSGIAQGSIDPSTEVLITTSQKGAYRVDGTNIFGWQLGKGAIGNVKMRVDLGGSSILWNVPEGGVFIDDAYALYAPKFENGAVFLFNFIGVRGTLFRTNNLPASPFNALQMPVFESLQIRGGSSQNENRPATLGNGFEFIFDITEGTNLCDRGLVSNCMIYQWKTFFRSANREAVGWRITNASTIMSYINGATLCNWLTPWSGGMSFDKSDILLKGTNQVMFKASGYVQGQPIPNSGEISIDCRIETNSSGVKLIEGTHGTYRFNNANFAAGSVSPLTNNIGDILGSTFVHFRNCVNIPNKVSLSAFKYSDPYPSSRDVLIIERGCQVVNGTLSIDRVLTWGAGSPIEYIAAIIAGYYIPGVTCDTDFPFISSRPPVSKAQMRRSTLLYGFNSESGNSTVNAANNEYSMSIPSQMLIDNINLYCTAVSSSVADSIGVYFNGIFSHAIPISAVTPTRTTGLPLGKVFSNSSKVKALISFKAILNGNNVPGDVIIFKAFIHLRGFIDKNDIDPSGRAVLVDDRNPIW